MAITGVIDRVVWCPCGMTRLGNRTPMFGVRLVPARSPKRRPRRQQTPSSLIDNTGLDRRSFGSELDDATRNVKHLRQSA